MLTRNASAALISLLMVTQALRGDETNSLRHKWDGRWDVVELVVDGTKMPIGKSSGKFSFQIDGETWRYSFVVGRKPATAVFTVSLEGAESPIAVDAKLRNGALAGGVCRGICQLNDDTIILCLADKPSVGRPARFESVAGSNLQLFVMRRAKAAVPRK